jgi:hypothetical protein
VGESSEWSCSSLSIDSVPQILVNAVTSEVDLDEGNFAGLATYGDLGRSQRPKSVSPDNYAADHNRE